MDEITKKVKNQYNKYPYPSIPTDKLTEEVLYTTNYEYSNYLCSGIYRSHKNINILDAGCGTGFSTLKLLQQNPESNITAIDISPGSLKIAKERLKKSGLDTSKVEFIEADLTEIDYLGKKFDYIVSTGVLHHLHSPELGMINLVKHLNDKGLMYLMLYRSKSRFWLDQTREIINLFRKDDENFDDGIKTGKELLKSISKDHPIYQDYNKMYESIKQQFGVEFADSDPQFVDAYLNVQEASYDLDELFEFLETFSLKFLRFLNEQSWDINYIFSKNNYLIEKSAKLNRLEKYKIVDNLVNHGNYSFFTGSEDFKVIRLEDKELDDYKFKFFSLTKKTSLNIENENIINFKSPINLEMNLREPALELLNHLTEEIKIKDIIKNYSKAQKISSDESSVIIKGFLRMFDTSGMIYFYK